MKFSWDYICFILKFYSIQSLFKCSRVPCRKLIKIFYKALIFAQFQGLIDGHTMKFWSPETWKTHVANKTKNYDLYVFCGGLSLDIKTWHFFYWSLIRFITLCWESIRNNSIMKFDSVRGTWKSIMTCRRCHVLVRHFGGQWQEKSLQNVNWGVFAELLIELRWYLRIIYMPIKKLSRRKSVGQ